MGIAGTAGARLVQVLETHRQYRTVSDIHGGCSGDCLCTYRPHVECTVAAGGFAGGAARAGGCTSGAGAGAVAVGGGAAGGRAGAGAGAGAGAAAGGGGGGGSGGGRDSPG